MTGRKSATNTSGITAAEPPATRPVLHMTARQGWINDPLGLTYHGGLYHLFFQYVPAQVVWSAECRWGHAVSEDLLTWTEQDVVLAPGDGDDGCWSGSLVVDDAGRATIFYTSIQLDHLNIGRIRTAQPDDETWNTWRKGAVVSGINAPDEAAIFRDPHVSRDGNGWRMLIGSGRNDGTATSLAYTSANLTEWRFDGEFASRSGTERDPLWTGTVWECPQLIGFGDRHALLFSVWEPWIPYYEAYAVGRLVAGEFMIETWGRLSYGDSYYAGATFTDAAGRPGMIYWLRGIDDPEGRWAGANSVPHLLRLDDTNVLIAEPHPNLADRRRHGVNITADASLAGADLPPVAEANWDPNPNQPASLNVVSADGAPVVRMLTDDLAMHIEIGHKTWKVPYSGHVRVLFDGPVIELFSDAGIFAAPIPVAGTRTVSVTNSDCSIYEL